MPSNQNKLVLQYFGTSHIGMVRSENQDSFGKFPLDNLDLYSDRGQLFIVADGVGGHTGGREASSTAVETIGELFFSKDISDPATALKQSVEEGNLAIYKKAQNSKELATMATTCSALLLKDNYGIVAHVGDSRVYKIYNNKLEQITEDHTKVLEMLKEGILNEEEAKNYPSKSVLARAMGVDENVKVDIYDSIKLQANQHFLLCSDGLAKVTPEEIVEIVVSNSPEAACNKLVQLANDRGGKDNVTVEIVRIEEKKEQEKIIAPVLPEKKKNKKWIFFIAAAAFLIILSLMLKDWIPFLNNKDKVEINDTISAAVLSENVDATNSDLEPIDIANQLIKKGNLDAASIIYQEILIKKPMHLKALQGINKISDAYIKKADLFLAENNFSEALKYYRKVEDLQPGNEKVKRMIQAVEYRNKNGFDLNEPVGIDDGTADEVEEKNNQVIISKFNPHDWAFLNIENNQYETNENGIMFYGTAIEKKSFFNLNLSDLTISVGTNIYSSTGENGAGIIAGYSPPGSEQGERFFLLKSDGNNSYYLYRYSGNKFELLLTAESKIHDKKNTILKLTTAGKQINIFADNVQLGSWKDSEIIFGKVGVYADKNVLARFSNININGSN